MFGRRSKYRTSVVVLWLLCWPLVGLTAPRVVVSIPPIHSLVTGLMAGIEQPRLLIPGGQSPHGFSLKPSDMRALQRAELVVWVGPALETPLRKVLEGGTVRSAKVLELMSLPGLQLASRRAGGTWDTHGEEAGGERHGHEAHHRSGTPDGRKDARHSGGDPHIWLVPDNALRMLDAVRDALVRIDPGRAGRYRENARALAARIRELDHRLAVRLAPVRGVPYVVFHDAYQLFEQRYGLNAIGSVTVSADRMPGARRLHRLRRRIEALGAVCLFSEPQFEPRLAAALIEGTKVRSGELDPLGAALPPGEDGYFLLLNNLADTLIQCLGGGRGSEADR